MSRDTIAAIVRNPWWAVVGLVALGAMWVGSVDVQMDAFEAQVQPLTEVRRDLDSLRIETRHIGEVVREIRQLLWRQP